MRRVSTAVLFVVMLAVALAAQPSPLVKEVRSAIAANDLTTAARLVSERRASQGLTPEVLEAHSWLGRGALGAKDLAGAEKYARETYALATAQLKSRPLDQEPRLPIALGAAIEVLGQVEAARGARTEAIGFLNGELTKYGKTSIAKRIQKNINLISLEGKPVPALDLSEYLGPKPPTMASLKGKVVLMFFWAHWCSDCKSVAPTLAALEQKYGNRGLVIVAPTQRFGYVGGGKDAPPDVELRYIDDVRRESYPVLAGLSVPVSEANHLRFGVSTTPTLVLVDRGGIIRLYHPGKLTEAQLDGHLKPLL